MKSETDQPASLALPFRSWLLGRFRTIPFRSEGIEGTGPRDLGIPRTGSLGAADVVLRA